MGFFGTVRYSDELAKGNNWLSKFESAADVCRAPSRWLAKDVGAWLASNVNAGIGKSIETMSMIYTISKTSDEECYAITKYPISCKTGFAKMARVALGFLLSLPGFILSIPLMAIAYCSPEIRLKHQFKVLTDDQKAEWKKMVEERQTLAQQANGCDPISCIACAVCFMCSVMCYVVCCGGK